MTIPGQPSSQLQNYFPPQAAPMQSPRAMMPAYPQQTASHPVHGAVFDRFQQVQVKPDLRVGVGRKIYMALRHPVMLMRFRKTQGTAGEGLFERLKMYTTIRKAMDADTKDLFESLLKEGVLDDKRSDDGRSTLYHLYSIMTTRRSNGYSNEILAKEAIHILARPYIITQQFPPLSENVARQILQVRTNPGLLNRSVIQAPFKQITWKDLDIEHGATCVASSLMYYMADKEPAELARHLSELTSPMNAFFEKVRPEELSPDDPSKAFDILREHNIKYFVSAPGEITVRVENPPAGVLRAIDSQKVIQNREKFKTPDGQPSAKNPYQDMRTGVEAAYQSALMFLSTRSYDPAIDLRDDEWNPGEGSIGLTADEEALMQTIVKDIGGVGSVTYQMVGGKDNPAPGEEGQNFLYGYTRTFEQITSDIVESLRMGQPVIIGTIETEQNGAVYSPHVNTITGAFTDPRTRELMFTVADSDDGIPSLVVHSAREIIPQIHHAAYPLKISQRINKEIEALPSYYIPDQQDAARFNLLPQLIEQPAFQQPQPGAMDPSSQAYAPQITFQPENPWSQSAPVNPQPYQPQANPAYANPFQRMSA